MKVDFLREVISFVTLTTVVQDWQSDIDVGQGQLAAIWRWLRNLSASAPALF